jgi:DNA-binding Lrp family transcriptional regulator
MAERRDEIDTRLVQALQREGRASHLDLARELGVSRTLVAARVRDLLSSRTVRVIAAVDPALLGQHVLAHVSIEVAGAADPIARWLVDIPEAVLVSAVAGTHALVTEIRVGTHEELNAILERIRARDGVAAIDSRVYTRMLKGLFMPDYRSDVPVDAIDRRLIEALQVDGRTSYRELAEVVGLSPTSVRTRVTRLLDARVIKISAVEARGLHGRQLSMGLGVDVAALEPALLDHIARSDHVEFAAQTVGASDLVITIAGPSPAVLLGQLDELRCLPGVRRVEAWSHLRVFKEDYNRAIPVGADA